MDKISLDTLEVCNIVVTSSAGKQVPIKDQTISLSIFESIFQPLVTCEIVLIDALALAHDLPFIGEEILTVTLKTTNASSEIEYNFVLHGLDDVVHDHNNRHQVYTLSGVSVESIADAKISIQKGFLNPYNEVVVDVLNTFLQTTKQITTTPTKGVQRIIIPNLSPLKSVDFMRQKAVSNQYAYSPMMFYETSSGFFFVDMVTRFNDARSVDRASITRMYVPNTTETLNEYTKDAWKSIVTYETVSKHDSLSKTHNGAYYSNLNKFDLLTKTFEEVETKLSDVKGQFDLVSEGSFNTDSFIEDMSQRGATNYLVYTDSSRPTTHIDYIGQKVAYSTLLFQNIINAEFHGDTTLEAGKVLYLDIKKPTGLTSDEPNQEDTKQSGYYMISKLAHHITLSGEPSLRVSCELVKGASKNIDGKLK